MIRIDILIHVHYLSYVFDIWLSDTIKPARDLINSAAVFVAL
jgi:hypothetical protein